VLFISIDDLSGWVSSPHVEQYGVTPNLRRFAAAGMEFIAAMAPSPLCGPSRAAIMTGIGAARTGVYGNRPKMRALQPDLLSLTQCFREQGYRVAGAGKVFHGGQNGGESWSRYQGTRPDMLMSTPGIEPRPFSWGPMPIEDEWMGDYAVTQFAEEELNAEHGEPFFLALGLYKPHLPWKVPAKYFEAGFLDVEPSPVKENDLDDVPPVGQYFARAGIGFQGPVGGDDSMLDTYGNRRAAIQAYLASCKFADAMLGRILDSLERSAYADNTIVVIWSDHGWQFGAKGHWRKHALWRDSLHSVLMMRVPGGLQGRCDRVVSLIDIYPTLVELTGLRRPMGLEGRDLSPLLEDPSRSWDYPVLSTFGRGNHSVMTEDWHLIRYHDGTSELYAEDDLNEWSNLAADRRYQSALDEMEGHLPDHEAPGPVYVGEPSQPGDGK
jgi:arylsulfatase A-like enzyme